MRTPRLAALELRRFGRGRLTRAALVSVVLLPLLYGALYLWSFWDPYGNLGRVPVALVNQDRGAVAEGERLTAGDDIADGLRESGVFDWHEVSAEEARAGVRGGTFYLSLTVPADFSERIASGGGDDPRAGALEVRTDDSNNYIVGQISRSVFAEVRTAAAHKATRTFLDRIFVSFSDIHDATEKAATGADELAGGIERAKKGSEDLAGGLGEAQTGSDDLLKGLRRLHTGAGDLASGSRRVADGTEKLAGTVNGVADTVRPFLEENEDTIAGTARLVADSAAAIRGNLDTLAKTAPAAARTSAEASATLTEVHRVRCETSPLPDPACPDLEKAKDAAADVASVAADVERLIDGQQGDLSTLDRNLAALEKQADALADRAPHLSEDLDDAVGKINDLNRGAAAVAAGAKDLRAGLGRAKDGAGDLEQGVDALKSGADDLDGGIYRLVDGSGDLAGGLHDGAERIPDPDKAERDRRTDVMSDPVRLADSPLHRAANYGTAFAPYFIPLALWVGAMVAYMVIQPLNRRALAAGAPARRIAVAGWLPVAALGVLQVAALMSVLHWGVGLRPVRTAATVGFLLLVTLCFSAIVQWLNARFGAAGRILVLALLMLQLTSAGGTYPVETSPRFFAAIHPYLPMSHVVEALRRLITGGDTAPVLQACAVLLAYTLGALALTAVAARRKQVWTFDRLRPELSL